MSKYCILLLSTAVLCLGSVFGQGTIGKKTTISLGSYYFASYAEGILSLMTSLPVQGVGVIEIPAEYPVILLRFRPYLRLGRIISPSKEFFFTASTYRTALNLFFPRDFNDPDVSEGGERIRTTGRQYSLGGGMRFYRRKFGAVAPLGRYIELSTHFHVGGHIQEERNLDLRHQGIEFRGEMGRQLPLGKRMFINLGIGASYMSTFGFTMDTQILDYWERSIHTNNLASNLFYFHTAISMAR